MCAKTLTVESLEVVMAADEDLDVSVAVEVTHGAAVVINAVFPERCGLVFGGTGCK